MNVLGALFQSKKFTAMVGGGVFAIGNWLAGKVGFQMDPTTVNWVLTLVGAYIVAQGVADHGKEAAKIAAAVQAADAAAPSGWVPSANDMAAWAAKVATSDTVVAK